MIQIDQKYDKLLALVRFFAELMIYSIHDCIVYSFLAREKEATQYFRPKKDQQRPTLNLLKRQLPPLQ